MHALSISNLKKIYKNGLTAVDNINLEVEEGDFFALLGPNGAGKSTTIGIITSLVNKTAGTVKIYNYDLDTYPAEAKSLIGLVPQEFNFNIFEPIYSILMNQAGFYGIPKRKAKIQVEKYLHKLGLWEKRYMPPRMLSGGMKRRLMIARALVHEPKLLILDEPTAGVDVEIRRLMWQFLQEINQAGTTIILTTHYLEEAESLCKNIAIIHDGKIIENTSIKKLLHTLRIETFILYLEQSLHFAPKVADVQLRLIDDTTLEIDLPSTKSLSMVFAELMQQGISVKSVKNKVGRLEEFFVHLTKLDHNHGKQ